MSSRFGFILAFSLLVACGDWESQASRAGRLEARWTGADTGSISANATAEWCRDRLVLEIQAIQGDTGMAVALHSVDTVVADSYPVVEPARADSVPPSASVALRLFAQTAIKGYQGDSGTVRMERSRSGQLSGSLTARARSAQDGQQIRLSARFERVAVTPQERGCAARPPHTASDTAEDVELLH